MKLFLTLSFFVITIFSFSQTEKKVLFIGNSYTSANNLPSLISSLAQADGNPVLTEAHIPGGSQLNQHAVNSTVLDLIASKDWGYVVIQEQSQIPSFPHSQAQNLFYPHAKTLTDSVYANNECSVPLFYATWGRQNGDPQWDSINTFDKMNKRLFDAYTKAADDANAMLSPIGIGFTHVKQDANAVVNFNDLYTSDGSHPTIKGSYLAACIFNNIIFETSSTGNTFLPNGMNANESAYLQGVADHVVYVIDSIQIDFRADLSNNDFTSLVNEDEVSFTPTILEGEFESWDFGDGQTSTQENAVHTYTSTGSYEVIMYSSSNCQTDTVKQIVEIVTLNTVNENIESFEVYPNPSLNNVLNVIRGNNEKYSVYTPLGKEVYHGNENQLMLPNGIYFIKYKTQSRKVIVR